MHATYVQQQRAEVGLTTGAGGAVQTTSMSQHVSAVSTSALEAYAAFSSATSSLAHTVMEGVCGELRCQG